MEKTEILKKYIKDNKNIENYFFTGLKEKTIEQKYQFLKNHFVYDIMNSWNNLKSIANNVKIYKLGLTNEQQNNFFELMEIDPDYIYTDQEGTIDNFEWITKTEIFYNGRSGGYIVTTPKDSNKNILEWLGVEDIIYFDNYKEFKKEQNEYTGSYNYSYKNEIEEAYYYIKAFDKLCDILRSELIYILDNYKIEEEEQTLIKTVKTIVI